MLFHMGGGELITFPFNNTCLSTEWGMISFCLCIYFELTANQTTHSLKSLALFYVYVYVCLADELVACTLKVTIPVCGGRG